MALVLFLVGVTSPQISRKWFQIGAAGYKTKGYTNSYVCPLLRFWIGVLCVSMWKLGLQDTREECVFTCIVSMTELIYIHICLY